MTVIDTNVLSELMKEKPEPRVVGWVDSLPADSVWTTAITVFEIRHGLGILPRGQKQRTLTAAFEALLHNELSGRILEFTVAAATEAAAIAVNLRTGGVPVEIRDILIAGTVAAHAGSTLATRNTKDFSNTGRHPPRQSVGNCRTVIPKGKLSPSSPPPSASTRYTKSRSTAPAPSAAGPSSSTPPAAPRPSPAPASCPPRSASP